MPRTHVHDHGEHTHTHTHGAGDRDHEHGWHSSPETCTGDDTFGDEEGPCEPSGLIKTDWLYREKVIVIVPYVPKMLQPRIVSALPIDVAFFDVSASQYDYWDLLCQLFDRGRPFIVVEQDVVIPPTALDQWNACERTWCAHSYEVYAGDVMTAYGRLGHIGCVRYRPMPGMADALRSTGAVTWSKLDSRVYQLAFGLGYRAHQHFPNAEHLHEYQRA